MCVFFLSAHYALGRMWTLMNKAQSLPLKSESGGERQEGMSQVSSEAGRDQRRYLEEMRTDVWLEVRQAKG